MSNVYGRKLADTARKEALRCFHGYVMGTESNLDKIIRPFPKWTLEEADGLWCAAFVYHCCILAGIAIPIRPKECVTSNLAGCLAWEEWAVSDDRIAYHRADTSYDPVCGDIVLFDNVFCNSEHDHIGIVLENKEFSITVAEGNINNISGVLERSKDIHIRAYISIPDDFVY